MTTYAGLDGIRTAVVQRLQTQLHPYLEAFELEIGLGAGTLSHQPTEPGDLGLLPREITKAQRPALSLSEFPALLVVAQSVARTQLVGLETSHPALAPQTSTPDFKTYRRRYQMRIFGYVKGKNYDDATLARDRLETVLFRCLVDAAQLAENVEIDVGTYSASLSDVSMVPRAKSQTLAAWFSQFEISSIERISAPGVGRADTIGVEVDRLA